MTRDEKLILIHNYAAGIADAAKREAQGSPMDRVQNHGKNLGRMFELFASLGPNECPEKPFKLASSPAADAILSRLSPEAAA